jgi:hypothetical protein
MIPFQFTVDTADDFIGGLDVKEQLLSFLHPTSSQSCFMIIGQSGSGKTVLSKSIIDSYSNITYFRPIYEEYTNHKEFVDTVDKFVKTITMLEIFEKRSKLLFLDDIDTLFTVDRYANTYVNNLVLLIKKQQVKCKLLITCSAGQEKKVTELKKKILWAKLSNPQPAETIKFLQTRILKEKHVPEPKLQEYVKAMQCNVRSILCNLHMLFEEDNKSKLYHEGMIRKTHDQNILDILSAIIESPETRMKYIDIWLSTEAFLLCYIAYDNKHKCDKKAPFKSVYDIVTAFASTADIENLSYSHSDWFLGDICNLYRFGTFKHACKEHFVPEYTNVLTKTAQYYLQLKKQKETASKYNVNVMDTYHMSPSVAPIHKSDVPEYLQSLGKLVNIKKETIKKI